MDRAEILDRLKAAGKRPDPRSISARRRCSSPPPNTPISTSLARLALRLAGAGRIARRRRRLPLGAANALSRFLFEDLGFAGNHRDYYDPRNSYVNEVLKRRVGIPITLSLVYMEVGRRTGVPMQGVGLPGHFLMCHAEEPGLFVDAFHGGLLLSRDECVQRFRDLTHPDEPWSDEYLVPIAKRDMLTRMLRNLKVAHLRRKDNERALLTATMLICLRPDLAEERRDRGVVQSRLGRYAEAIEDLRGYLDRPPPAPTPRRCASSSTTSNASCGASAALSGAPAPPRGR